MDIQQHITMTVANFCAVSDIGKTKLYELFDAGESDYVLAGKRRLVVIQSYLDFLDRQAAAPQPLPSPIRVLVASPLSCQRLMTLTWS